MGGYHKVCDNSFWRKFTPPGEQQTKASSLIRVIYKKYLLAYERDHFKGYPRLELGNEVDYDYRDSPVVSSKSFEDSNEPGPPESSLQESIKKFYFNPVNVQWVYETDRIALALESGLPNEVEWGLEALLRWSSECPLSYSIEQFPSLRTVLLDEFSKYCTHLSSTLLRRSGTLVPMPFLLLTLGLRNCTLSEESAANLAETSELPEQITQLLMLPQSAPPLMDAVNYPELRTYCIDILDNMGTSIIPSPAFLNWLNHIILGDDRSQVLGGLRLMAKLLLGKHDEALELALDHEKLLRHIFALLTLPDDIELHAAVVEFLILYSYFLPDHLAACATQCPYLISSLLSLLMTRQNSGLELLTENNGNVLETIEHWLRSKYESNPLQKVAALDLYAEYMQEPPATRLPTLSATRLVRIARMVFPTSQIVQLRRRGKNLFS
ncbi:Chromatin structure-remodeling complex protein rsc9 [Entomophthora muscae]|uniref:Chromatin structure-remodeling complex protein rsc9 n=1 Tax=Entomophthora muscae TaxID=34485 RepID=A0ACC2U4N8_9FUNG|nr:Chromatin structure-remodeling complex protein rsc9 [Entomophthora muscae]